MKEHDKCKKKWAITNLNGAPNGSQGIPFHSQKFGQDGYCHFVGFQPHFHLNMMSQMQCCNKMKKWKCNISRVLKYLSKNEAKNLQNGDIHLAQIPNFKMGYLKNHLAHWGQWWLFFHFSRSFIWAKLFFWPEFPLTTYFLVIVQVSFYSV